jgi:Ser/Thr protein kinase RdoA (MazF antagonist)
MRDLQAGPQWNVSSDDAGAIAEAYGQAVMGMPAALGGATNGVVRLTTGHGEVIVRVQRPWTTPARIESVHRVQEYLRRRGLPLPAILRTLTGATWTLLHDRVVEVTEYVPNDGPADSWERMEVAIALLGLLHTALAELSPSMLVPPAYSSYAVPETALRMLQETEAAFKAESGREGYAAAAAVRAATYDLVRSLGAERAAYARSLPTMPIHGDYGADNVLMRGGEVAAILDFDFMAMRERIFELAYTLYWTLDRLHTPEAAETFDESGLRRAATLLRRYGQTAPKLTQAEIAALPFEMARVPLYPIVEAGYTAGLAYAPWPVAQTLAFARHIPVARRLIAEAARLSETLMP